MTRTRMSLLPLLLLPLLLVGRPAQAADEWKDARKAFRSAQKSQDWRVRKDAFSEMGYFDTADSVKEILRALRKEQNPATIMGAVETLSGFKAKPATDALGAALVKSRGEQKLYVLMALERQPGAAGKELLLAVLRGKDRMAAAQAALALGKKKVVEAIPDLRDLLVAKEWQLRAAAARAIQALRATEAVPDLVEGLAISEGSERGQIINALAELTGEKFGADVNAWKKHAKGLATDAIPHTPVKIPHVFGIPIYGRRVVLILTNSQRNEDAHRFGTGARIEELCLVPGGDPIPHTRLPTVGLFIRAHFRRVLSDLPRGTYADLVVFNTSVTPHFGKLTRLNQSLKNQLNGAIDGAVSGAGMNHYGALTMALDVSGARDKQAWTKGPDEIVFTICNSPNQGEIKEPAVVAAAIAFKARLRMVPIHAVGVETHAFDMLRTLTKETGGTYVNLVK